MKINVEIELSEHEIRRLGETLQEPRERERDREHGMREHFINKTMDLLTRVTEPYFRNLFAQDRGTRREPPTSCLDKTED